MEAKVKDVVALLQALWTMHSEHVLTDQSKDRLTTVMVASVPPDQQKQMFGERLFPLISKICPDYAGKITGMMLEIDNSDLPHILESRESLEGGESQRGNCCAGNLKKLLILNLVHIINIKV